MYREAEMEAAPFRIMEEEKEHAYYPRLCG